LEEYCYKNNYEWFYEEDTVYDKKDGCYYYNEEVGELNFIDLGFDEDGNHKDYLGRRGFENITHKFEDVSDTFIDNECAALPSWIDIPKEWETDNVIYQHGWYGKQDKPEDFIKKHTKQGKVTLFQVHAISAFEIQYLVYTKCNNLVLGDLKNAKSNKTN